MQIVAGTVFFGSVNVGKDTYISGNVTIKNGIKIGSNCMIGMGSVVTRNVLNGRSVFGNPATVITQIKKS